jgi:hypothetical protein
MQPRSHFRGLNVAEYSGGLKIAQIEKPLANHKKALYHVEPAWFLLPWLPFCGSSRIDLRFDVRDRWLNFRGGYSFEK